MMSFSKMQRDDCYVAPAHRNRARIDIRMLSGRGHQVSRWNESVQLVPAAVLRSG
jgi:hypothetical protein